MSQNDTAGVPRKLAHTRQIVCSGYTREDGLYDIEAHMTDTKGHDSALLFKDVPVGGAIHDMWLTITVDENLVIRAAHARTDTAPTPWCAQINEAYAKLAGIAIGNGFMKEVKARLGGTHGCTHLTELLGPMATTAFQTLMGLQSGAHERLAEFAGGAPAPLLPMLDTCHAWRADGDVVQVLRERTAGSVARTEVPANV
ncbi:DUF2889 domain-containing protein [Paraburkholderia sp. JHI869]|uniref:DUF2889 domain-containing protein n=1 Tax=Paraburkholderia sp. JHI869 TaxID=3112959 RepID=UPI00317160E6